MAEATPLRRLRSCALAIICGKPEEIPIIADALGAIDKISGQAVDGVDNGHLFYVGRMSFVNGKTLGFYVTSSLRQGLVPFAIATGALISVLRPRFAIHTGVCAGNKEQGVKIMDVVCGDAAMSLEDGKWALKNGQLAFLPDYETVAVPVAELAPFADTRRNVHYGFYVSGSAVREDAPAIFEKIQTTINRKVLALEMEASAFIKLCSHSRHTNVIPLGVIKGVSDLGDQDRGKDPEVYYEALRKVGAILESWIRSCFSSMTWEANEVNEPGAKLAKNYYTNFVQKIVDALRYGLDVKIVDDDRATAPPVRSCIKIVMPQNDNVVDYAEQGQIDSIAERYGLQFVSVGKKGYVRTAYMKNDCLFDFPRCLNQLLESEDAEPEYQAVVFKRQLQTKPYFKQGGSEEAHAEVMTWEEFLEICTRT